MIINIILKSIFVYFVIVFCLKFMGKREIGQITLLDFAILLIISDVLVIGVDEDNKHFWAYLIAVILLCAIQRLFAFLLLKSKKLRDSFDGIESVLIYEGKLNVEEMKKQRFNMDDLIIQLRTNGVASLKEVKYLILENNGKLSVFKYQDKPANPLPVIVSGKLNYRNIKLLNLTVEWIISKLNKNKIEEIYYASLENDDLFIISLLDKKTTNI